MRREIFDYLKKLENTDFREIKRYLESPYFNVTSRKRVIVLFEQLKQHHPKYENLTDTFISKKLKIGVTSIRNLKTILINCIEHYLELKVLGNQKQLKTWLRAQAYDDLNMHQYFIRYADIQLAKLAQKVCLNKADYQLKYELLSKKYGIIGHSMIDANNLSLQRAINTFTKYFLYESLINLNGLISTNLMVDRGAEINLTNQLINSISNFELIDDVNIKSAYLIFKYYNLDNTQHKEKENVYDALKKLVENEWVKLTEVCKYETYQHMINMANSVVENNAKNFKDEDFIIHQFWIDKKVHLVHPEMHHNLFLSIVISSCNAQKLEWCKKFIDNNMEMIPIKERTSTVAYSWAYYDFCSSKFDDAIAKLYAIQPLSVYFNLIVRMLMLRCLFAANNSSRFDDYCNATNNFIRNHTELNESIKNYHLKFIVYLKKINKAFQQKNIEKLIRTEKEIRDTTNLTRYKWLIKLIEKLTSEL